MLSITRYVACNIKRNLKKKIIKLLQPYLINNMENNFNVDMEKLQVYTTPVYPHTGIICTTESGHKLDN